MSLELTGLTVAAGARTLLHPLDLTLAPGEALAVVGPNGAGKTTLVRAAIGLLTPTAGTVSLDGQPLQAMRPRQRAAWLGWLPQHPDVRERLTAIEVVAAARFRFDESRAASLAAAHETLGAVGAAHLTDRVMPTLSGGEAQRVALAALAAQEAPLRLLDEPANHLDPAVQVEVYQRLGAWWQSGCGLLLVTHDVNLLGHLGDPSRIRVLGLREGREAFRLMLSDPALPEALGQLYGVSVVTVRAHGRDHILMGTPTGAS